MKSDVEIAQEAVIRPIAEVAEKLELSADDLEFYGKYKAKISLEAWSRLQNRPDGKLILVTAINPTPAGEGKTTTSVGLGDAFHKMGKKVAVALREPSLGPCGRALFPLPYDGGTACFKTVVCKNGIPGKTGN